MTTSIVIFGWIFLSLLTTVYLESSRCDDDDWWTSGNVLFGTYTPVYFLRSDHHGQALIEQDNAMENLRESRWFRKADARRTNISNKCPHDDEFIDPDTIFPKIGIVVDYGIYRRYEENLTALLEYLIAIWNGVDLNFREFEHPKVRLNIAGIIIANLRGLPFLYQLIDKNGWLQIRTGTKHVARFMEHPQHQRFHFDHYHIAVVMTSAKTYMEHGDSVSAWHKSRTMCTDIDTKGPAARVLFSDDGRWIRATRELTYILGNSFESSSENDGGGLCPLDESLVTGNDNKPLWSQCLLDSFKKRLNTTEAKCFYEKPYVMAPLPRVLPGEILHRDKQLTGISEKKGCDIDESICHAFICSMDKFELMGRHSWSPAYAPDGTPCAKGKICFRRKCVFENDLY